MILVLVKIYDIYYCMCTVDCKYAIYFSVMACAINTIYLLDYKHKM